MSEWRDIPGYDGWYQVNEHGEVRSWRMRGRGWKRLKDPVMIKGYIKNGRHCVNMTDYLGKVHCYTIKSLMKVVGFDVVDSRTKGRPVEKVDGHGNVLESYPSARAAGRSNHISCDAVRYYCDGKNKNLISGCFTFRYAEVCV